MFTPPESFRPRRLVRVLARLVPSLALAGSALLPLLAPQFSQAAAPMVKTQAPGFYRLMVGDFEVTALSDGTAALPIDKLMQHAAPGEVQKGLDKAYLTAPVETSFNGFLVNTGAKLVLIDTGAAGLFGPTLGKLAANLKVAGYQPEQVDEIYITHMHGDHVGGLIAGVTEANKLAFPNAIVRADQHDADYWLSPANLAAAPADAKGFFQGAMASLNPYVSAGKFKPFDGDTELMPGVRALATRGHTPGHSSYLIESKGQKLYVLGDLIHLGAVQFADPAVTIQFDVDSKAAAVQRKRLFDEIAKGHALAAGAHLSFPGIGHLRVEGKAYAWVPLNYSAAVGP